MARRAWAGILACIALAAIGVGSASAAATTEASKWYAEGVELAAPLKVSTTIGNHPELGEKFQLKTEIGGLPIEKTGTGLECVGCVIENKEVTSKAGKVAFGSGKVKITGVTYTTPANCSVKDENGVAGQLLSKSVLIHADLMEGTKHLVQFIPAAGATFLQFEITGPGCAAIQGKYNVSGSLLAEIKGSTGVSSKSKEVVFSQAINNAAGGKLLVGTKELTIKGTAILKTEGEKSFAAK